MFEIGLAVLVFLMMIVGGGLIAIAIAMISKK